MQFNKLLEQKLSEGCTLREYGDTVRDLCGLVRNRNGWKFDPSRQEIRASDVSLQELAYNMLGPDYRRILEQNWAAAVNYHRLLESGSGGQVMASTFANISGLITTVIGLLDAIVWENYNNPAFNGLQLVDVRERRVEGGKIIGVRPDRNLEIAGLAKGEELPTIGLQEVWVNVAESKRYGARIQIDQFAFIFDRTDQIVDACTRTVNKILHSVEKEIASYALGVSNNYRFCDTANNFYQTSAGSAPFDFVNQLTNPLSDWTAVNKARQALEGNKDFSGLPITLPIANVYVMPQAELSARTILHATEILTGSQYESLNFPLSVRRSENPVQGFNLVPLNRVWYNVLREAGLNDAAAAGLWLYGDLKKAIMFAQIMPLTSQAAPLAADEIARGIALDYQVQMCGAVVQYDPRYVCKNTIA